MGHERIGMLPKSKRWRTIVSEVASSGTSPDSISEIAEHTLTALGSRYRDLAQDPSVQEAFSFLVGVARSVRQTVGGDSTAEKTPLALISTLSEKLSATNGSLETRELVRRAAADALAAWHRENAGRQSDLFAGESPRSQWQDLGTGAGFCELSRLYFSRLTERYLNYFLDREASSALPTLTARTEFQRRLHEHIADISRLSFDSAKITQSYAAGWFHKHALTKEPSATQKKKFLAYAFDKLREEFRREAKQ